MKDCLQSSVKYLDPIFGKAAPKFNTPTGILLVYGLNTVKHNFPADEKAVGKATEAIAGQGMVK